MARLSALFSCKGLRHGAGIPTGGKDPLKDFFDTWKFKILVAVAVFLVGIMAYAGANGRLTAAPQELLGVILTPFQKAAAVVSGGVGAVWEKYTSIDEVMKQNEQLEAENAELRQQMVDYDRLKAENEAYKALANIQKKNSNATYVSGFVIGRDPLDEFGGFTLDKGTADGVAVNDAVISDRGYLLGMVVEADPTSCKVMTILHPSFNAAGVVSRTRENGILNGNTTYAADGLCTLTNLERSTETRAGDQVITTGLGGVFPPDLLVGTVQDVVPEASGKSSIAVVRPGADPRTAKHVFIITAY
jgi:rod shape-determining protein MreC